MSEINVGAQNPPQPDADAMATIMKKVARVQKILGLLSKGQGLLGLIALTSPLWASLLGAQPYTLALLFLAPFLFGLAYAASIAKKDLSFARVVFRNTAISHLGLLLITFYATLTFTLPALFYVLVAATLILGGLPAMVIYQALKEQK